MCECMCVVSAFNRQGWLSCYFCWSFGDCGSSLRSHQQDIREVCFPTCCSQKSLWKATLLLASLRSLLSSWQPEVEALRLLDKLGSFIITADGPFQEGVRSQGRPVSTYRWLSSQNSGRLPRDPANFKMATSPSNPIQKWRACHDPPAFEASTPHGFKARSIRRGAGC